MSLEDKLGRVIRWRYVIIAAALLVGVVRSDGLWQGGLTLRPFASGEDWSLLVTAAQKLTAAHGLSVFVEVPGLQTGPLSLVITRVILLLPPLAAGVAAHVLMLAALPLVLLLSERTAMALVAGREEPQRIRLITLLAGLVLFQPWSAATSAFFHIDDACALTFVAISMWAFVRRQPVLTGLAMACAVDAKPWAIGGLAILMLLPHGRRRAVIVAAVVVSAVWLPFILGNLATVHAASVTAFAVNPVAPVRVLGLMGPMSAPWGRPVELTGIALAALIASRRGWTGVFAASMSARLLLDWAAYSYYTLDVLLPLAAYEIITRQLPWRTALVWLALVYDPGHLSNTAAGYLRLVVLSALVVELTTAPLLSTSVARMRHRWLRSRTAPLARQARQSMSLSASATPRETVVSR